MIYRQRWVYEVNATTMRFKISDQKAREKILRRGVWNIVGVSMVVSKWVPRTEEEKQEEESIPMWIHLTKVPLHMFSWEGLSLIASPVRCPVKLHPETIACTSFEVAKVFVNVDVSKALPREMTFSKDGEEFLVEFHYPWLPSRCKHCNKWGHNQKVCILKGKNKEKGVLTRSNSKDVNTIEKIEEGQKEIGEMSRNETSEEVSTCRTEETVKDISMGKEKEVSEVAWALVSPGKAGRSQTNNPKENDSEILISTSKYSVLSANEEEEGEIVEKEKENEYEDLEVSEKMEDYEEDIEDDLLMSSKGKEKSVVKRGRKKGQKTMARAANPVKSKRSSRLKK